MSIASGRARRRLALYGLPGLLVVGAVSFLVWGADRGAGGRATRGGNEGGGSSGGAGAARVATADPAEIFNSLQETLDLQDKLEEEGARLAGEQQERAAELKQMRDAMRGIRPDSEQYEEMSQRFIEKKTEMDAWGKMVKVTAERKKMRQSLALFRKVWDGIQQVAEREGIDLVLTRETPEIPQNIDTVSSQELMARILQRNVLYSSANTDISEQVVELLNSQYQGSGAGTAAGKASGNRKGKGKARPKAGARPRQPVQDQGAPDATGEEGAGGDAAAGKGEDGAADEPILPPGE